MAYACPRGGNAKPRFLFNRANLPAPLNYYVVIEKMKLTGAGEWRTSLCPFHGDKTPSLRINIQTGGYRCMACGAKGRDVLAFHMQRHSLPFVDACKALGAWGNS